MPIEVVGAGRRWEEPKGERKEPQPTDNTFEGFLATNALAYKLEDQFRGDPGLASSHIQPAENPGEL